jgi:hypothetical protein
MIREHRLPAWVRTSKTSVLPIKDKWKAWGGQVGAGFKHALATLALSLNYKSHSQFSEFIDDGHFHGEAVPLEVRGKGWEG